MDFIHVIIILVVGFAQLFLFISALLSILKTPNVSTTARAVWVVITFVFPILGPLVWFVTGRSSAIHPA